MPNKMFAVLSIVGAFAITPAFAQTTGTPSSSPPPNAGNMVQTLQQDLQKAGFTDVKVMPEAYLIRAKDSHGSPVLIRVGPDSVTELAEVSARGSAGANTGNGTPSPTSTTK